MFSIYHLVRCHGSQLWKRLDFGAFVARLTIGLGKNVLDCLLDCHFVSTLIRS